MLARDPVNFAPNAQLVDGPFPDDTDLLVSFARSLSREI